MRPAGGMGGTRHRVCGQGGGRGAAAPTLKQGLHVVSLQPCTPRGNMGTLARVHPGDTSQDHGQAGRGSGADGCPSGWRYLQQEAPTRPEGSVPVGEGLETPLGAPRTLPGTRSAHGLPSAVQGRLTTLAGRVPDSFPSPGVSLSPVSSGTAVQRQPLEAASGQGGLIAKSSCRLAGVFTGGPQSLGAESFSGDARRQLESGGQASLGAGRAAGSPNLVLSARAQGWPWAAVVFMAACFREARVCWGWRDGGGGSCFFCWKCSLDLA